MSGTLAMQVDVAKRFNLPRGPRLGRLSALSVVYRPRRYYAELRRRFGDIVTLRPQPNVTLVMTLSSEGARQLFSADPEGFGAFPKEAFAGLAGPGSLWVLEGERHRRERRLLSQPFHASGLRGYGNAMQEAALRHTDEWRRGQSIRAFDAMLAISRDVVLITLLGTKGGALLDEGRKVLTKTVHDANPLASFSTEFQSWWFPPWVRMRRTCREFSTFVTRCLQEYRAQRIESENLLGLMMTAQYDDGTSMSDDAIRDELYTILLSGHETTAIALSWALYELGRHPAVLARLRDELDAIEPDPGVIARQTYLAAVCNETLRLHTIVPEAPRTALEPVELLGYTLPPGTGVGASISAIHQDPSIYAEPDQFTPERFLGRTYRPFEFLPFGGSHRRCLGAAFSDYEMRIVLGTVVSRWEFELAGEDRESRLNIAVGPKHGVRLRILERRGKAA